MFVFEFRLPEPAAAERRAGSTREPGRGIGKMASFRFGGAAALAVAGAMLLGACEETRPDIPRPVIADSEIAKADASIQGEWVPPPAGWNSYDEQTRAIRRVVPRMRTASSRLCREQRFPQLGNAAQCTRMLHSWLEDVNLAYYDDNVNAWVQPDGKIVFASGLMQVAANDDEIAFVLGHEMAHGFAGHFDKQLQGAAGGALVGGLLAAGLAAAFCPECPSQDNWQAAEYGAHAGATLGAVQYSPERELEADEYGIVLASYAGYDPRAGRDLQIRIARGAEGKNVVPGLGVSSFRSFLRTHPTDTHRLAHFDEIIRKYGL